MGSGDDSDVERPPVDQAQSATSDDAGLGGGAASGSGFALGTIRDRLRHRGENASRADAERAVDRSQRLGYLMDDAIRIPGIRYRIGLDPLVGVAPVSGDAVAAAASLYIVAEGFRLGAPYRTLVAMLSRIGLDFFFGSIPILGTVIDAVLKVNQRNAEALDSYVESAFR